jgi:peptide deformylase
VFINPEIVARDGDQVYQEGCLSVPGIYADVTRANRITVRSRTRRPAARAGRRRPAGGVHPARDGSPDGKLFVDYLSPLKREMVRKKLAKQRRHAA